MSSLLRQILLGVVLATGTTAGMTVMPTAAHAGTTAIAYGHGFATRRAAEEVRVARFPTAFGFRTFVEYRQNGPMGAAWYICYYIP